jgi:hypothetical protein
LIIKLFLCNASNSKVDDSHYRVELLLFI